MTKKTTERRSYTQEFKTAAVALAEKKEKPISHVAKDLGLNENVLRRWIAQTREAAGTNITTFPGHGRPRDLEGFSTFVDYDRFSDSCHSVISLRK